MNAAVAAAAAAADPQQAQAAAAANQGWVADAAQQGNSNVSHGCINLSPDDAKWFFDNVKRGDVVINTNTGGPDLKPWDGFGDWQIRWGQWVSGNK